MLVGGNGRDQLSGGHGSDVFCFDQNDSRNIVSDFEVRFDTIEVTSGANSFDDLELSQRTRGVLVSFAATEVMLEGLSIRDLSSDQFDFV